MRLRTAAGVSLVVSLALAATDKSQPLNVKIGLWQMTYTTERNGVSVGQAIAPGLLAKMTPDQRARTEARLRARAQGPRVETKQYCLTQERLKNAIFDSAQSQACQRTMLASTPKLQQFHEECIESGTKRMADGHFEALDFDTMKGSIKIKTDGANPLALNVEIAGRWISNDCGDTAQ